MHRPPFRRPARGLIVCLIGLLALAGCQEDVITHAVVPRAAEPEKTRLVGVIYPDPHGEQTWFFKLMGPETAVAEAGPSFSDFVNSVRLTGKADAPVAWTLPAGWEKEDAKPPLYASFRVGTADMPAKATVASLPKKKDSEVLDNVIRWRRQLGLGPVTADELKGMTKELTVNGDPATLVDFVGTASSAPKRPMGGPMAALPPARDWTYQKPADWTEMPADAGPVRREAVFQAVDGGQTAEVSVTALPGPAGGLAENLARWARQIDAAPPDADKLPTVVVAGRESPYVDMAGQKGRILGAVVARGDRTWFFKMMGPADLVEKQKPTFEAFLKSVKFEGQGGE